MSTTTKTTPAANSDPVVRVLAWETIKFRTVAIRLDGARFTLDATKTPEGSWRGSVFVHQGTSERKIFNATRKDWSELQAVLTKAAQDWRDTKQLVTCPDCSGTGEGQPILTGLAKPTTIKTSCVKCSGIGRVTT